MTAISCTQFTSLYIQFVYEQRGQSQQEAENHIAKIQITRNIISLFLSLIIGKLSDKFPLWKVWAVINCVVIFFCSMMVIDMLNHDQRDLSIWFDIGNIGALGTYVSAYMVSIIYLSKLCNPNTRATIFNVNGLAGSIFVLLMNLVGGTLYTKAGKAWPIVLGTGFFVISTLLTLIFGFCGKLKV